jgi:hypothetical protein
MMGIGLQIVTTACSQVQGRLPNLHPAESGKFQLYLVCFTELNHR